MRRRLIWVAVALAVITGLWVDRCASSSGRPAALADAQRIWWDHGRDTEEGAPPPGVAFSFWMLRDFALGADELTRGARSARLVLLGDPEVLVYWNGVLVHSTHYRVGGAADVLDVSQLLRAHNRILLEVRSDHGAGGVMAALWLDQWPGDSLEGKQPGDGPLWITDDQWLATRRFDPWLLDAWLPLDTSRTKDHLRPVRTWPELDLGRWQPLRVADELVQPTWPSTRQSRRVPERLTPLETEDAAPGGTPTWPRGWVVDFGESVRGCLALGGVMAFPRRAHFVEDPATFSELHGPVEFAAQHRLGPGYRESWILPMPGAPQWLDAVPRSFRAVLLEGDPHGPGVDPRDIWVQPCATDGEPAGLDRLFGS